MNRRIAQVEIESRVEFCCLQWFAKADEGRGEQILIQRAAELVVRQESQDPGMYGTRGAVLPRHLRRQNADKRVMAQGIYKHIRKINIYARKNGEKRLK